MRTITLTILAIFGLGSIARGQQIAWSTEGRVLQEGKAYEIFLTVSDCEPKALPSDLSTPAVAVTQSGSQRTSSSIYNGRVTMSVSYGYAVVPHQLGSVSIPEFQVETNKGTVTVPPVAFEVVEPTVGNTGLNPEDVFVSKFSIDDAKIYVGEVFDLDYFAGAEPRFRNLSLSDPVWKPNDLVATELKFVLDGRVNIDGKSYLARHYKLSAIGTRPGLAEQPSMQQTISVSVGMRGSGFFSEPNFESFSLSSEPFAIQIVPLPEGAPQSFAGAVGQFQLESKVVPETVKLGEPVTWTLELSGEGNWPAGIGVPARSVSSSFKSIKPDLKTEFAEGELFNGKQTEDIVLIPTRTGSFTFGPIEYSYFDPKSESYKTIKVPATNVVVEAAAAPTDSAFHPSSSGETQPPGPREEQYDLTPQGENTGTRLPSLPREPATTRTAKPIPTGGVDLIWPTVYALAIPLGLWLVLAFAKAVWLDPSKSRRIAFRRLQAMTVEVGRAASNEEFRKKLYGWREAARQFWQLRTAEATPQDIQAAVFSTGRSDLANDWKSLWEETDRALFSAQEVAIDRWKQMAQSALLASPKPSRRIAPFWSKSVWLGLTAFALSFFLPPQLNGVQVDDPATRYDAGEFAKAESLWVKQAQENREVWELRYNAGLAAAQQDEWARAWAHWTSAFCLNPRDERILWNLRVAQTNNAAYDPTLQRLIDREDFDWFVTLLSPANWERTAHLLIWLACGALCFVVASRFVPFLRRTTFSAVALGFLLGISAHFAVWAHDEYGHLARLDTVLITKETSLKSIPSDLAEDKQIETEVGAGTIATVEKSFLGWSKIKLPNGDIGWIRKSAYQPLYGPPNEAQDRSG